MVTEIACLVLAAAENTIAQRPSEYDNPELSLRGGIMWAMLSVEVGHGTSKEDLLKCVGRLYDIMVQPPDSKTTS